MEPQKYDDSYMIDIAASREYRHQSSEYREAFTRWRNDLRNKLGYRFVHDSREHTYIDGGGFADKQLITAETDALHRCLQFLGALMLLYFGLEQLMFLLLRFNYERVHIERIYYSLRNITNVAPSNEVYLFCSFRLILLIVPIAIMTYIVRLPLRVAVPRDKADRDILIYGFAISMVMMVCFRFLDYGFSHLLRAVRIDVTYYTYLQTDTEKAQIFYFICELILCPVLSEILFRGYLLQMFRQFGDNFAIFISSLAAAMVYHDISKIMYVFSIGIVLGVFTLRCGNIIPTIFIQLAVTNISMLLNSLSSEIYNMVNRLTEVGICFVILLSFFPVMVFMRVRLEDPFRLRMDSTELTFTQKMRQMLNSPWMVVWMIIVLITTILSVSFI